VDDGTFAMLVDLAGFALVEALEAVDAIDARFIVWRMGTAYDVAVVALGTALIVVAVESSNAKSHSNKTTHPNPVAPPHHN
jgi:hypothetical protein